MTKMIYIPPFQMMGEPQFGTAFRHLMLPHLIHNERYSHFFSMAKRLGQYIILDNGKAEKQEISHKQLAGVAFSYNVDEVVLPDSMGDPEETEALSRMFLADYKGSLPVRTKFGYVLHGRTAFELTQTYDKLRRTRLYDQIDVLYLPRISVTPAYPMTRISVAEYILGEERLPKAIHFLGASPHYIMEGQSIRTHVPRVRSMDTSAPFVYALNDAYINEGSKMQRDIDTYFTSLWPESKRHIAKQNMEIMDGWIGSQASASQV